MVDTIQLAEFSCPAGHGGTESRNGKDKVGIFHPLQELRDGIASE